jgi:phasin
MSSFEQGAKTARDNLRQGEAAAYDAMSQMERGLSASMGTMRDFNLKMIEMMRANAEATFDFAENLCTAKSPTEVFETWKTFAEHQGQTLQKQTQEFASLTQSVAQEATQPLRQATGRS